jgi:hypothetical protein
MKNHVITGILLTGTGLHPGDYPVRKSDKSDLIYASRLWFGLALR